jgi:hypothetical protein
MTSLAHQAKFFIMEQIFIIWAQNIEPLHNSQIDKKYFVSTDTRIIYTFTL